MMYFVIHYYFFLQDIEKNGVKSIGKILSYEAEEKGYKTPIIEFKTLEGKYIKKKPYFYASTDLSKIRSYKNNLNKTVEILYHPNYHEKFLIASESTFNYGILIFMFLISVIFITLSILAFIGYIEINT